MARATTDKDTTYLLDAGGHYIETHPNDKPLTLARDMNDDVWHFGADFNKIKDPLRYKEFIVRQWVNALKMTPAQRMTLMYQPGKSLSLRGFKALVQYLVHATTFALLSSTQG